LALPRRTYSSQAARAIAAPLPPTPATLLVPAGHRLARSDDVRLADLDGERLLTWNPPGTPYTDLLLSRLAAAGARVTPVQARITAPDNAPEVAAANAVAIMPVGWPVGNDAAEVKLLERVDLPMLVVWAVGASTPFVRRLRAGMRSGGAGRAQGGSRAAARR
jgi:hypothetical protein